MIDKDEVLHFIDRFTGNGARSEVIDCFSNGCCYWFATILKERFADDYNTPYLVYDPVINHWACCISNNIYDITGCITFDTQYHWQEWQDFKYADLRLTERLYQDCINF